MNLAFEGGTTLAKFQAFIELHLLPALVGTGRRVITFDNLNSHCGDVSYVIKEAGHRIVLRPALTWLWTAVEMVFGMIRRFLVHHDTLDDKSLYSALRSALTIITADHNIRGFFAHCHFMIDGVIVDIVRRSLKSVQLNTRVRVGRWQKQRPWRPETLFQATNFFHFQKVSI